MAFVEVNDGWKIALLGHSGGSLHPWAMTFGAKDTDAHTPARGEAVAHAFLAWWESDLQDRVSANETLVSISVLDLESEFGTSIHYTTGLPENGGHSGDPAGGQVAAITTFFAAGRGRSRRGRSYRVGVVATDINAGDGTTLDADAATADQTAYTNLNDAIQGDLDGNIAHAIISLKDAVAYPVIDYQTRRYLGTQRRRVRA